MTDTLSDNANLLPFKNDGTVIRSTTLSLSRNLAGYKFVPKESKEKLGLILETISAKFAASFNANFEYFEPEYQDPFLNDILSEDQVTSIDFSERDYPRGLFISKILGITAVINDYNHLKLQMTAKGLETSKCWEELNQMDDVIEEDVQYSFSPQFGYLTTSPQDVGTGLKISFAMHLPALAMHGKVSDLYDFAQAKDLDISGCRGDCDPEGDMLKITNNVTIGKSEQETIDETRKIVIKIAQYELQTRKLLISEQADLLNDSTQRAMGVLKYAQMINYIEAINLLSKVKLGIFAGTVKGVTLEKIDEVIDKITPARLNYDNCELLDFNREELIRAKLIRESLGRSR